MGAGAVIGGVFTIALGAAALAGLGVPAWLFFTALAFMGGAAALMMVPYRFVVQSSVPPGRIARVFAAGDAISVAVMLAAPFAGSAAASAGHRLRLRRGRRGSALPLRLIVIGPARRA